MPEPAKHQGRMEHVSTRLFCRFPSSDTRGRPLFPPHGVGLFAGHSAPAVGTCMFEFPRFHPMKHSRLAVRTDHLLLSRVAHQLSHRFTSHHPSRLAPVTHHRVIAYTPDSACGSCTLTQPVAANVNPMHKAKKADRPRFVFMMKSSSLMSPDFDPCLGGTFFLFSPRAVHARQHVSCR